MKANFDISLPSIPGKNIKFKIQDIKSAAFGAQKARFPDNKSLLTKKFVESFSNFHEPDPNKTQNSSKRDDDQETQAQTQYLERSRLMQRETKFRTMVSDNKKFLIPVFNKIRKQERQYPSVNFSLTDVNQKDEKRYKVNKKGISYSFGRAQKEVGFPKNGQQEEVQNQNTRKYQSYNHNQDDTPITDNYYFTVDQRQTNLIQQKEQKKTRPSAVFKNQTRKRFEDRFYSSTNPGPGAYIKDEQNDKKNKKSKGKRVNEKRSSEEMDYKRLKQVITNIVSEQPGYEEDEQDSDNMKEIKNDHMFVLDDRDRFGNQAFPIATRVNVPGPGAYEVNDTMEERSKKIILVQEQRKLLKQWFNN